MQCDRPLRVYKAPGGKIIWDPPLEGRRGHSYLPLTLPCGRCMGCRLEKSRQSAVRCVHEAQVAGPSSFVTLTYERPPPGGSLVKSDLQKFHKRVARRCGPFRFFGCGEYGDETFRPHFHSLLFGVWFEDRVPFSGAGTSSALYTSDLLSQLWPFGHATAGDVTFESAAYVARYVTKKVMGDAADEHYCRMDEYGQTVQVEPEFCVSSNGGRNRSGGIGAPWFDKFYREVYGRDGLRDSVVVRGAEARPPRYYDKRLAVVDPELAEKVRRGRYRVPDAHESSDDRLRVRGVVRAARAALSKRSL